MLLEMLVKCVLLLLCYHLLLAGAMSEFTPFVYPAQISSQCGQHNSDNEQLMKALQQVKQHIPNRVVTTSHSSCKSILDNSTSAPSGYYHITTTNGSIVLVYCDMEGINCGGEGGWIRVAYVNMTQPGATCPQGLEQKSIDGSLYCGSKFSSGRGCRSAFLNTTDSYQQVCGRVVGYQYGHPYAFNSYIISTTDINGAFFDGISLMYGIPRKHIFTYTAGAADGNTFADSCPCNHGNTYPFPPYVGNSYYCESGNRGSGGISCILYSNDPLWDGQQCDGSETSCCTQPNMPWFIKTLNETTTEDIELRVCSQYNDCGTGTSVAIFLIEIYVR